MAEDRYFKMEIEVRNCLDCPYYGEGLFHRSCLLASSKNKYKNDFEGTESLPDWCPKLLTKFK